MFGIRPAVVCVLGTSVAVLVGGAAFYVGSQVHTDAFSRGSGARFSLSATAGGGYVACPLTPPDSTSILVDFTEGGTVPASQLMLIANGTLDDARYGPVQKAIPYGTYTVRFASYVPTAGGSFSNQRWYASFGAGDMTLGRTDPSSDVPDNSLLFQDPVAQTLSLTAAAVHVYVQHAGFDTQAQTGEYVIPLCMLLTPTGVGGGGGIQSSSPLTQTVTCPLTRSANSILIDFTAGGTVVADTLALVANGTAMDAQYGPITIPAIPAGPYRVRFASYAPPGLGAEYLHQRWYLFLETESGTMIGKSEPSGDVPSGIEVYQDTIEQRLAFTTAPVRAGARHAAYGKQTPELVVPLCALFTYDPGTQQVEPQNVVQEETASFPNNEEPIEETTAVVQETYPTCPIMARSGRAIVDFTNKGTVPLSGLTVYANGTSLKSLSVSLPSTTPIPPGRYEARLAAMHATDTSDTYETWYGTLFDSAGGVVARTPNAKDVPTWEKVFVSKTEVFPLTRSAVRFLGVHAHYPADTPSPVAILCAAFDRVGDLVEEPVSTTTAPVVTAPAPAPASTPVPVSAPASTAAAETVVVPRATVLPKPVPREPAPATPVAVPQAVEAMIPEIVVSSERLGITMGTTSVSIPLHVVEARERLGTTTTLFERLATASAEERATAVEDLVKHERGAGSTTPVVVDLVRASDEKATVPDTSSDEGTQRMRTFFALARRSGAAEQTRDADGDGVSDFDEVNLYHSDPLHPFTGRGVLSDGERVLLGLDPTQDSLTPVVSESPRYAGEPLPNLFHVASIDLVQVARDTTSIDAVRIVGTSTPYSFVTLYVYSTPIIVTVRADVDGRFEYTLDKALDDGSHELYLASVNNTGKVLAKSTPIPFVKTAQAIEYTPVAATVDPVNTALQRMVTLALLGMLALSVGGIILIGAMRARRMDGESAASSQPHA